jgi:DNA-binding response OmpR family regulator
MRVLYIEDYPVLRESVSACLREESFAVDAVADGKEGLWMARENPYDIIVLDLTMPGMDGLEILRRLREEGNETPVLITSARDAIGQRVEGLGLGADDYLVKPFALEELVARVRTLVRRGYGTSQPVTRIGDMELDTSRKEVRRGGELIPLTVREYALLEYLAIRKGQVVSRTDIWEHVYEYYSSATSNVVDVYVGYLRQKLNAGGRENLIQTRRGFGYVLEEAT